jgi:hypothetical protein
LAVIGLVWPLPSKKQKNLNEWLLLLYIIKVTKTKKMKWVGHVARTEEIVRWFSVVRKEREHLRDIGVDGRTV